jgi:hypothetical protein
VVGVSEAVPGTASGAVSGVASGAASQVVAAAVSSRAVSVMTGMPRVTFAVTFTLRSSRSVNASARAWSADSDSSLAAYSWPNRVIADHATADVAAGTNADHHVAPSGPGRVSTNRSRAVRRCAARSCSPANLTLLDHLFDINSTSAPIHLQDSQIANELPISQDLVLGAQVVARAAT